MVNLLGELCWRGKLELDDSTFDQLIKIADENSDKLLSEAAVAALDLGFLSLEKTQTNPQRQFLIREILQRRGKPRPLPQRGAAVPKKRP